MSLSNLLQEMEVAVAKVDMALYAGACIAFGDSTLEGQSSWCPPPLPSLESSLVGNVPMHCVSSSPGNKDTNVCDDHNDSKLNDNDCIDSNCKTIGSSEHDCDDMNMNPSAVNVDSKFSIISACVGGN